eukprot:7056392-Ditylum_brightwellii.AAC.1
MRCWMLLSPRLCKISKTRNKPTTPRKNSPPKGNDPNPLMHFSDQENDSSLAEDAQEQNQDNAEEEDTDSNAENELGFNHTSHTTNYETLTQPTSNARSKTSPSSNENDKDTTNEENNPETQAYKDGIEEPGETAPPVSPPVIMKPSEKQERDMRDIDHHLLQEENK